MVGAPDRFGHPRPGNYKTSEHYTVGQFSATMYIVKQWLSSCVYVEAVEEETALYKSYQAMTCAITIGVGLTTGEGARDGSWGRGIQYEYELK